MRNIKRVVPWGLSVAVAAAATSAHGAFVLMENFQDVAVGSDLAAANAGENFSSATTGKFTAFEDPTDPLNVLLRTTNATDAGITAPLQAQVGGASLVIADGTTATLFYRIYRRGTTPNFNAGLSDVTGTGSGDYESQLNVQDTADDFFQVRDGDNNSTTTSGFTITSRVFDPDTWLGVFQVIDNGDALNPQTDESTRFYIQSATDASPVLLTGGDNIFTFRNDTAGALTNFLVRSTGGTDFFVDDIYVDLSGENLVAPVTIPEPASLGLLAMAGMGLIGRRRRAAH